jgi:hypothetical protein
VEPSLIAELSKFGPMTLLAGMTIFMLRDEIKALLGAGRRDSAVEGVMTQMVGLFEKNLVHFEALSRQAEKWVEHQEATTDEVKAAHETLRQIMTELARGNAARGGK